MTDNVDAVCGSRSNPQDYEGVEDMLLNPKLRCNSKACRYRHGTDFQAGLKIARTGPCRYSHDPIRTPDNDRLVLRISRRCPSRLAMMSGSINPGLRVRVKKRIQDKRRVRPRWGPALHAGDQD
jgi:hypothetical protein